MHSVARYTLARFLYIYIHTLQLANKILNYRLYKPRTGFRRGTNDLKARQVFNTSITYFSPLLQLQRNHPYVSTSRVHSIKIHERFPRCSVQHRNTSPSIRQLTIASTSSNAPPTPAIFPQHRINISAFATCIYTHTCVSASHCTAAEERNAPPPPPNVRAKSELPLALNGAECTSCAFNEAPALYSAASIYCTECIVVQGIESRGGSNATMTRAIKIRPLFASANGSLLCPSLSASFSLQPRSLAITADLSLLRSVC